MMTTQQSKPLSSRRGIAPGLWYMDKLFKEFGEETFYNKFVEGGYKLTQDIKNEWKERYMDSLPVCDLSTFLDWAENLEWEYNKKFIKRKDFINFHQFIRYIVPITAPKLNEQFNEEITSKILTI